MSSRTTPQTTRTYSGQIAEEAAAAINRRFNLLREPQETQIEALAWSIGQVDDLPLTTALELIVEAALLAHCANTPVCQSTSSMSICPGRTVDAEHEAYMDAVLTQGPGN